ncbi:MAG: HEAT repeat domain-containing protein [Acidobacteriota bacterium]|nr:HEAT repeat domain-containing protein [Acidobacteriota bacterium]
MKCEQVKEGIPLYFYGELAPELEENVEAHCAQCEPCAGEVDKYRAFAQALNENEMEPSLGLLAECRQLLAARVGEIERPAPGFSWWRKLLNSHIDLRVPAGAVALIAVGWFGAKLSPGVIGMTQGAGFSQSGMTSMVRSVEPDAYGRVRIAVDDVHRRVVSGGVDDAKIKQLLLAAAREESSPGVRVESVDMLKNMAASQDVRTALLDAVQHDPNPGVRLKALEGLKQFSADASVRKALTSVLLKDANSGVRIQVIDLLVTHRDDSMVGMLQNLVRREEDGYVRVRLQRALQDMNASVGTF